jgi:hypothetical protein
MSLSSVLARVAVGSLCVFSVACSGAAERPDMADMDHDINGARGLVELNDEQLAALDFGEAAGSCQTEETRRCSIKLASQNGVHNCFVGEQHCSEGSWGACVDPMDD